MKRLGVQTAVLSVTAPGPCILSGPASFDLALKLNEYDVSLRDNDPNDSSIASLSSLFGTDAAFSEIAYALDTLQTDSITVLTRYGQRHMYLGHPSLELVWAELVWAELNRRKCVAFVRPTHLQRQWIPNYCHQPLTARTRQRSKQWT